MYRGSNVKVCSRQIDIDVSIVVNGKVAISTLRKLLTSDACRSGKGPVWSINEQGLKFLNDIFFFNPRNIDEDSQTKTQRICLL